MTFNHKCDNNCSSFKSIAQLNIDKHRNIEYLTCICVQCSAATQSPRVDDRRWLTQKS